jgi:hypothetical protein
MTRTPLLLVASLTAAGCADKIGSARPDAPPPTTTDDAPPVPAGKVTTTRDPATGTYTTVVDATSMTAWIHADFETGTEAIDTGPWDLRFQRTHISANGGVTGSGGVTVAPLTGTTFDAVTSAPATGYLSDTADTNGDGRPEYVFEQGDGWYDYNVDTHVLTPKPIVWVLRTDAGATRKLEIMKYYDPAGTSAWFTLHWGPL